MTARLLLCVALCAGLVASAWALTDQPAPKSARLGTAKTTQAGQAGQAAQAVPPLAGVRPQGTSKPPLDASFLKDASYTGSAACKDCHEKQYASWAKSGHANMLRPPSETAIQVPFPSEVKLNVEVETADKQKVKLTPTVKLERQGETYLMTLVDADNPGNNVVLPVVEVVGGIWEQQFYVKAGDQVFASPVRYVLRDKAFRLAAFSPFWWEADGTPDGRPVLVDKLPAKQNTDMTCNGCHATGNKVTKDPQAKTGFAIKQAEHSIGCEMCHGPGSKHVADPGKNNVVRTRELSDAQSEQLCGQCHFRVINKKEKDILYPMDFLPGMTDLADRAQLYTYATYPGFFWPNGDSNKNRQQYHDAQRSPHQGNGMSCLGCHSGHKGTQARLLAAPRQEQCVQCHTTQAFTLEGSTHKQKGLACVDCHMAKLGNRAAATSVSPKPAFDVTAHTQRPVLPETAQALGPMPSTCGTCHKGEAEKAVAASLDAGRRQVLAKLTDARARLASAKTGPGTARAKELVALVGVDGSLGAHNQARINGLLDEALGLLPQK